MADLTRYIGQPPAARKVDPPDVQLRDAIAAAGITPPDLVYLDGRIHRFASGTGSTGRESSKAGWYIAFGDGVPAGRFGCWRAGIEHGWTADVGREITPAEEMAHRRRMAEAQAARDAELERTREAAADAVERIWSAAAPASPDHPYLARKGIGPHGARVTGDGRLVVPLYHPDGHLASLQYIAADGGKLYHPGGQAGGCSWMVGTLDDTTGPVYVAEGFATAATIHEETSRPCVVAYSASQLVPATGTLRQRLGAAAQIVIVADHDKSGVGQRYADQASALYGARTILPPELGDANDFRAAGGDLAALLSPPVTAWLIPADDLAAQPAPLKWLVKHWLPAGSLAMVHGPSGGGKTFLVLDWLLRLGAGMDEWHGHRVRGGPVVYLAGEGHHGLRARIAAWRQRHGVGSIEAWVSREGCDLDTPAGYQRAAEAIRALAVSPALIVIDTLHRFLSGNENDSQDVRKMLDACAALQAEFGATVLLVHHTGVDQEKQHRARGSSAWRGALDAEISIVPAKRPGEPVQVVARKLKDAELPDPAWIELVSVTITGWLDEDGEPVSSAVAVPCDAPVGGDKARKDTPATKAMRTWERAWWASGAEVVGGKPYLTRSALRALLEADGHPEKTSRNYTAANGAIVGPLLEYEIITPEADGWVVIDAAECSALLVKK